MEETALDMAIRNLKRELAALDQRQRLERQPLVDKLVDLICLMPAPPLILDPATLSEQVRRELGIEL